MRDRERGRSGHDRFDPLLTTRAVPAPDHVMSANVLLGNGSWKWYRKVETEPCSRRRPCRASSAFGYVVTYRLANDQEWRYAPDDQSATPGIWPEDPLRLIGDLSTGDESFVMMLPAAQFPTGDHVVRVDCFDRTRVLHVAHHEVVVKVRR